MFETGGGGHEKRDLPEAFYEHRTREFGGESLFQKKVNFGLAEMQFSTVLKG